MTVASDAHHAPEGSRAAPVDAREIRVRHISLSDLADALKGGLEDFRAQPSHLIMLGFIYAAGAAIGAGVSLDQDIAPLVFPIVAGLALTGPFAAILLYEISRRREAGKPFSWGDTWSVIRRASSGSILVLGAFLLVIFGVWLVVAQAIFNATFGAADYTGPLDFLRQVLTTPEGWTLILVGNAVGFLFAALVLATNIVSFPLLLDRHAGAPAAVATSLRVTAKSPVTVAVWGFIIAVSMAVATALFLVGLAVVVPVLGHATWRLYRKAVEPPAGSPA